MALRYTPDRPLSAADLGPDEILVTDAAPGGDPGLDGDVYAVCTDYPCVADIRPGTDAFLELASEWDQTTFIVTRLGVRRGFSDADIAPLFDRALDLYNVVLPEAYVSILVAARIRDGRSLPGGLQE